MKNAKDLVRVFPAPNWRDRLRRMAWNLVQATLFRFSPNAAFAWRRLLLRSFGAKLEGKPRPYPTCKVWAPWNLRMGHYSCLASGVTCYNVASITLGRYATVSQGAHLCSASHDFRDPSFPLVAGEIAIGECAWVAADAFVGPGVTIGNRAVVGARAVVSKNVAEEMVVAGNPARIVSDQGASKRGTL